MTGFFRGWLDEALELMGEETDAVVTNAYVGKGDFNGTTCFAVTFSPQVNAWVLLAALGAVAERTGGFDALVLARDARHDFVGRGSNIYFPGWSLDRKSVV